MNEQAKSLLEEILFTLLKEGNFPDYLRFRVRHQQFRPLLDELEKQDLIRRRGDLLCLSAKGLVVLGDSHSKSVLAGCDSLISKLKNIYSKNPKNAKVTSQELSEALLEEAIDVSIWLTFLTMGMPFWGSHNFEPTSGLVTEISIKEEVLDLLTLAEQFKQVDQDRSQGKASRSQKSPQPTRWKVKKSLGEGGQARTYLVEDSSQAPSRLMVKKVLKNKNRIERFRAEFAALERLNHPNILRVAEVDFDSDAPFFLSEFCELGSLEGKKFPLDRAFSMFDQVCSAVGFAHRSGITHRDIKPSNILLRASGEVVVADFGLCFIEDFERHTEIDEAVGPRLYMAPELEDGRAEDITPKADVYSLGKLFYWMLSGGKEFAREKHRAEKFNLVGLSKDPRFEHVNKILDRMIAEDRSARFNDANEIGLHLPELRHLLSSNINVVDMNVRQRCLYCGVGDYKIQVNGNLTDAGNFGFAPRGMADVGALACTKCGHVQLFRLDLAEDKSGWPKSPNRK